LKANFERAHLDIIDAILFQCRSNPALPALCAPGTQLNVVSYGRLERFIYNVAANAKQRGLTSGATVVLYCDDPILHSALILGLTYAGIVTLSARNAHIPAGVSVTAAISDRAIPFPGVATVLVADHSWLAGDAISATRPRVASDMPCRLILTSGTTGNAKCVALTNRMIMDRVALHNFAFGNQMPICDRIFCDLGVSTSLGFLFLIHSLMRGGMLVWRGADASQTMQAFGLYGVQAMIASPSGLGEFLHYYEQSPKFGSPFRIVVSAGSLLSPRLANSVRARLCPNLMSLYGSTETSMVAVAPAHVLQNHPKAVGYVLPGATIQIVTASEAVLPAGLEGRIRIRTDCMATSYMGTSDGQSFIDGWFYPGDTGILTSEGLLLIGGRETSVINLGGDKINPETLEAALQAQPGVTEAGVFSELDEMGIEQLRIAVVADESVSDQALRECCGRLIPPEQVPARILRAAKLPRNAMGKLDRQILANDSRAKQRTS
jgi:acyl-CoA synthetase (AMP-forming)/AMP-acid ligase II